VATCVHCHADSSSISAAISCSSYVMSKCKVTCMVCAAPGGYFDRSQSRPAICPVMTAEVGRCRRIDEPMCQHMETEGLEFLQFSFRWVNCLLLREIPFQLGLRLWDTYLAEGPGMKEFLIYALAAFLLTWEKDLKQMDFQVNEDDVMAHASAVLHMYNHILWPPLCLLPQHHLD